MRLIALLLLFEFYVFFATVFLELSSNFGALKVSCREAVVSL
jgi:hypothetical protein